MATFALPAGRFDTEVLQRHWITLSKSDIDTAAVLRERLGVDFAQVGSGVRESESFLYLPVAMNSAHGDGTERDSIVFALGADFLITLQPDAHFALFDKAVAKMQRNPALTASSHSVMYALLWALNEVSSDVVRDGSDALDAVSDDIEKATQGHRDVGVAEVREITSRMNEVEQVVSRVRETQLQLARAARHLMADAPKSLDGLEAMIAVLIADINGVKEHAGFEHDKVRYRQQSLLLPLAYSKRKSWLR
ncbi:CorA family divalent cation transporter [Nocardia sp. KC 131]|uniref:CorA family divalent cation transporter n=1 Tax=Nocardia arseniciresistens TaxID=3392119 RepID=UPI00398E7DB0